MTDDTRCQVDVFATGTLDCRPFADPSFLVPAIIDALRLSPKHRALVHVVDEEADTFCARHVHACGGTVLTSDSDLLVHNLGEGQVVFFRDIHKRADSGVICSSYSPAQICAKIGQPSPQGLTRLAYEQKRSPQSSLAQILRASSLLDVNDEDYRHFCREYQHCEADGRSTLKAGSLCGIDRLDPRLSELAVYLRQPVCAGESRGDARVFLPVLMESSARGSAWEHSTPVRQLAYTLLIGLGPPYSVLEFRRIQSTTQKGRRIEMMSADQAQQFASETLDLFRRIRRIDNVNENHLWLMFCLALDIIECQREDKRSHAWRTFQQQPSKKKGNEASLVSWDVVHLIAQLQAVCYSLRLLCQAMSAASARTGGYFPPRVWELSSILDHLPPLADFPCLENVMAIIMHPDHHELVDFMRRTLGITSMPTSDGVAHCEASRNVKETSARKREVPATKTRSSAGQNMFEALQIE